MIKTRTIKSLLTVLLPFTVVLLLGCTFEPTDEYFKEIEKITPLASIDLSDYNDEDTILLIQPTTFKFNVEISQPSKLEQVEIVLDSKSIVSSYTASGNFVLSQSFISPGIHQLSIQFRAKSNSGSLADEVGAEYFQVWRTWVLKVVRFDNDPPSVPELKITEKDGLLRLDWTPYTKKNFVSYKLKLSFPNEHEIVFNDSLATYWVDSSFLWGSASYALTVTNTYGSASNSAHIDEPQQFMFNYNDSDSIASLKWNPSRFYNAFSSVVITENNTVRETITKASDSTFTLKLKEVLWGRSESIMLQIFPKNNQRYPFEAREFVFNAVQTTRLNGLPVLYYQNGINRVVGHSRNWALVYFYDDQMHVTDSVTLYSSAIAVPFSGNFIYYQNNNGIVRWNLLTGDQVYSYDYTNYTIDASSIHGTANGLVSYFSMNKQNPWDLRVSSAVQNTFDNTFIERTEGNYDPKESLPPRSRILSDDGRFFLNVYSRMIYKLDGGLQPVGTLPYIGAFLSFRPDNNDEILLTGYESLSIISSLDLSLLRTIAVPAGYSVVSYDPVTHYIVCEKMNSPVVYLINIDTNDARTFPAYSTGWQMINGYLYNSGRQCMKVI